MMNELLRQACGDIWKVVEKEKFSIAIGKPLIIITGLYDKHFNKNMENFLNENEILEEEVLLIGTDEADNITYLKYQEDESINPVIDYYMVTNYLANCPGIVDIEKMSEYLKEDRLDNIIQRISSNLIYDLEIKLCREEEHENKVKGYGNILSNQKSWYRVSDIDSNALLKKAAIFGVFGGHQFSTENYLMGILYLFTGGFCGIGVLIDIILLLIGKYSYKEYSYEVNDKGKVKKRITEKLYVKKPDLDFKTKLFFLIVTVMVACIINLFIYPKLLLFFGSATNSLINNPDFIQSISDTSQKQNVLNVIFSR